MQKQELSMKWGIRTQAPKFASMFLILVLAVALPTTFNFVGEFTVL
jgi:NADH-quinone oxidoreductase subunit M